MMGGNTEAQCKARGGPCAGFQSTSSLTYPSTLWLHGSSPTTPAVNAASLENVSYAAKASLQMQGLFLTEGQSHQG